MHLLGATRDFTARETLLSFGTKQLASLCEAAGVGRESDALVAAFQKLVRPWGTYPIGDGPRFPSNVSDDQAPFEFCIAVSEEAPEVQVYVDVQGEPPSLRANMIAGRALLDELAGDLDASLAPLRRVEDLFFPHSPAPPFALWIGLSGRAGQGILPKVYLHPGVRGPQHSFDLVAQAMERLQFGRAWSNARALLPNRAGRDEAAIVCLDLDRREVGRVKVYLRHHQAMISDIDAIARLADNYQPDDARLFYGALAGSAGPFVRKPLITELVFVDPRAERPASVTLEYPIGSYVESDQVASARIVDCMTTFGLRSEAYQRALRAFARRSLEERAGIHAHVTLRRPGGRARIAVYLASEPFRNPTMERQP